MQMVLIESVQALKYQSQDLRCHPNEMQVNGILIAEVSALINATGNVRCHSPSLSLLISCHLALLPQNPPKLFFILYWKAHRTHWQPFSVELISTEETVDVFSTCTNEFFINESLN